MPKIKWEEIDVVLHKCKDALNDLHNIGLQHKKMRETLGSLIEELEKVILEQVENNNH